jgi:hypothetical protein
VGGAGGEGVKGRDGFARRLTVINGLTACLILCAVGLFASDAVGPAHAALLGLIALYQRWRWSGRGGTPEARRLWWEILSLGALLFFIADLFLVTRNLIGAALRLLLFIVAYHADNPQPPRRARQTFGLTLIQMIAASASTTEVAFSILMAAYLGVALWTLAAVGAAQREQEDGAVSPGAPAAPIRLPLARVTTASVPAVLIVGLGVFFILPHYGTGYFRERGRSLQRNLTGFSDRIELGSIGSIKKSHATVMRVRQAGPDEPPPLPIRLRGIALDLYDGRTWRVADTSSRALRPDRRGAYLITPALLPPDVDLEVFPTGSPREQTRGRNWLSLEILLEPLATRVLFTPPDLVTLTTTRFHTLYVDRHGSLFAAGPTMRRFPYRTASLLEATSPAPPGEAPPGGIGYYLQLPVLNPRIATLAGEIAGDAGSPEARARAIERHLLEQYAYSLDVNDAAVAAPMTRFLIEKRPGHCEYFATAMAILLRLNGVPSRVVNGFYGGEYSELTGQAIIRQSDAHSWVEAWIPGRGWVTFDPTPPDPGAGSWSLIASLRTLFDEAEIAWDTYIVGLDMDDQRNALEEVRDRVDLALAGAVIRVRGLLGTLRSFLAGPGSWFLKAALGLGAVIALAALLQGLHAALRAWRRWRGVSGDLHPATHLFRRFEEALGRRGLHREPSVSPAAFARHAGAPEIAAAFEAARYGPPTGRHGALDELRRRITDRGAA